MGLFGSNGSGTLQREHDRLMRRSRDAADKGFEGTSREARQAAERIARQIEDEQEPPQAWHPAHP